MHSFLLKDVAHKIKVLQKAPGENVNPTPSLIHTYAHHQGYSFVLSLQGHFYSPVGIMAGTEPPPAESCLHSMGLFYFMFGMKSVKEGPG